MYIILHIIIIISSLSGELFAVGAFNTLRLCDKTGVRCIREPCVQKLIYNSRMQRR